MRTPNVKIPSAGESVQTPRGSFHLTSFSKEQMETAGYGVHHNSDDGCYHIMGNGIRSFAVVNAEVQDQEHKVEISALTAEIDRTFREYSSESCGRLRRDRAAQAIFPDLTGQTFGDLTVIRQIENTGSKDRKFDY